MDVRNPAHMSNENNHKKDRKINVFLNPLFWGAVVFLFILSFFSGAYFGPGFLNKFDAENSGQIGINSQRQKGNYKFINPLLECDYSQNIFSKNVVNMETKIKKDIEEMIREGAAESVSLYYRDLNNGPWFGINEDENYKPASLLKVPILMAYLKKIDNRMDLLSGTLSYSENEIEMPEPAQQLESLNPEEKYSLETLFERMIIYSDNQAYALLVNKIDSDNLDMVMQDLGMTLPAENGTENILTAKSYASLFRVLYNASYLSRNTSEYALDLMSRVRYEKGLTDNLPEEIAVSHKFGLRRDTEVEGIVYLHDCGIIYYPEKPYLLCVMTKGKDYDKLTQIISTLSSNIYQQIKNQ